MQIQIRVPGVPVAQPRTKATIRGAHAGVYTPTKKSSGASNGVAEFKAAIRLVASNHHKGSLLSGPVAVCLDFVFPRQNTKVWKSKPMPRYHKVTKPDSDNLAKLVLDCLNQVLWYDDMQVCDLHVRKWFAAGDEVPHTVISVKDCNGS